MEENKKKETLQRYLIKLTWSANNKNDMHKSKNDSTELVFGLIIKTYFSSKVQFVPPPQLLSYEKEKKG